MANLTAQDLVPLANVFNANVDDANYAGLARHTRSRLDAARSVRQSLEASARRRHEMEVHLSRLRQAGLDRRIKELQAPRVFNRPTSADDVVEVSTDQTQASED